MSPGLYSVSLLLNDAGLTACQDNLSNIGTGDFHISFTLETTQSGNTAVMNQRPTCGGDFDFWDIRLGATYEGAGGPGYLLVNTGGSYAGEDEWNLTNVASTLTVNDGRSHDVVVERVSGVLTILVDQVAAGTAASLSSFAGLPPLDVGVGICDASNGGGPLGSEPFVGTLTNVCVTSP
jgi:hypothetical protein